MIGRTITTATCLQLVKPIINILFPAHGSSLFQARIGKREQRVAAARMYTRAIYGVCTDNAIYMQPLTFVCISSPVISVDQV